MPLDNQSDNPNREWRQTKEPGVGEFEHFVAQTLQTGSSQPGTLSLEKLSKILSYLESRWWFVRRLFFNKADYSRFNDPGENYWRYRARPLVQTIVYGSFALFLILGQLWVSDWNAAHSDFLGDFEGFARLAMLLLGFYFAFLAWPEYRHKDATDEDDAKRRAAVEEFHRRRRASRDW